MVSEMKARCALIEMGYDISIPEGELRYDLVADIDDTLYRVQVKSSHIGANGSIKADLRTCSINTKGRNRNTYDKSEIDAYIIVNDDNIYWLWFDEVGTRINRVKSSMEEHLIDEKLK